MIPCKLHVPSTENMSLKQFFFQRREYKSNFKFQKRYRLSADFYTQNVSRVLIAISLRE